MPSARRTALAALTQWRRSRRFADSILGELLDGTRLGASDRAFALELFYGVLRNLTLLDFWIGLLRSARVQADLRDILRLGLYQLLLTDTSEHAAVYETVELAPPRQRAVINGVLRSALRKRSDLLAGAKAQPLSVRRSHPDFLIARWEKAFGAESTDTLCLWNNQPPPVYARINELKISPEEFLRTYPGAKPVPGYPLFVTGASFPRDAIERGECYVQDPSTSLACRLLAPRPGETVLDACAAPGGKTSHLAALMRNEGVIVACDRDKPRIEILRQNLGRLGVTTVRDVQCNWLRDKVPDAVASVGPFDRILVDAPCSNTGVMRRRVDVRWRLQPDDFERMPREQIAILGKVIPLLKPGGVLVYSTCSLEREENEEVCAQIARNFSGRVLKEEQALRPFRDQVDGAFAARLVRV